ncbi:MAG TPA: hypothetical protein PK052_09915 [Anaerohalosphaeraceae bacterium]|nr:hypothetical protein [Phycisphaerae bacterium]HOK95749.1 hypothetical protein [Anaerohalosphaeraceae bacterium]HOL32284.1 hypothetical protein [Anaerohalosphaeraceae bacterium]HOM77117.1 hypothetical protein [Anaerohalosphaeraceae bacterium]HPC64299.1 hypothetical protein [Anaerohalosphaeraceae bacterium]
MYFKHSTDQLRGRFRWHYLFAAAAAAAGLCYFIGLSMQQDQPPLTAARFFISAARILFWMGGLTAVFAGLRLLYAAVQNLKTNSEKLDNAVEMLSRQNNLLMQISQASRLSDTAKEIVFRDSEQMELGEAALTRLHQHDFAEAESMIRAMAEQPKYKELAGRLKLMADKYRSATEEGRVNQIIAHIEDLFEQKLWIQAAAQIDNLIKTFPYSEKAKTMPARLQERKDRRKRELLADWDLAVRQKNTDQSIEILKELDLYLTPSEALALRESASTVFKTKLHNLGVEFSVAVTEQNWQKALQTGRIIVQNFPNSRMAAEIRSKMDILLERAASTAKSKPKTP